MANRSRKLAPAEPLPADDDVQNPAGIAPPEPGTEPVGGAVAGAVAGAAVGQAVKEPVDRDEPVEEKDKRDG